MSQDHSEKYFSIFTISVSSEHSWFTRDCDIYSSNCLGISLCRGEDKSSLTVLWEVARLIMKFYKKAFLLLSTVFPRLRTSLSFMSNYLLVSSELIAGIYLSIYRRQNFLLFHLHVLGMWKKTGTGSLSTQLQSYQHFTTSCETWPGFCHDAECDVGLLMIRKKNPCCQTIHL